MLNSHVKPSQQWINLACLFRLLSLQLLLPSLASFFYTEEVDFEAFVSFVSIDSILNVIGEVLV
jgi:hypothetical protein